MSTITVTNIKATGETASRAVSGVAAYWINFNGTGTVAVRDSFNNSSLVDNTTGDYTVSYTNNMADANHSFSHNGVARDSNRAGAFIGTRADALNPSDPSAYYSSSSHTINVAYGSDGTLNGNAGDSDTVCMQINGDLA